MADAVLQKVVVDSDSLAYLLNMALKNICRIRERRGNVSLFLTYILDVDCTISEEFGHSRNTLCSQYGIDPTSKGSEL